MRTFVALACVCLAGCDVSSKVVAKYPPPPAGSFTPLTARIALSGGSVPTAGAMVTPDFFKTTTVQPMVGRLFIAPGEFTQSGARVVALSADLWRKRFDAAPDVIGSVINIDAAPTTVVAVLPYEFQYPPDAKFWIPQRIGS